METKLIVGLASFLFALGIFLPSSLHEVKLICLLFGGSVLFLHIVCD